MSRNTTRQHNAIGAADEQRRSTRKAAPRNDRGDAAPLPLSFMCTHRGRRWDEKAYWNSEAALPAIYHDIADAEVRTGHQAFFVGRQRAAEYVRHVQQKGRAALNLSWIVGDMPADVLASMSLSGTAASMRDVDSTARGLAAGFFWGLMEMAGGLVGPGDIELDAVRMDAALAGQADGGQRTVLHSARQPS